MSRLSSAPIAILCATLLLAGCNPEPQDEVTGVRKAVEATRWNGRRRT